MASRHESNDRSCPHAVGALASTCLLLLLSLACSDQRLQPGAPIDAVLEPGATHRYRIAVPAEHYLRLVVEQHGADLEVALPGVPEQSLARFETFEDGEGEEQLLLISASAMALCLQISAPQVAAGDRGGAGELRYRANLLELRPMVPEDRSRLRAEQLLSEGVRLYRSSESDEERRQAIGTIREALPLWRSATYPQGEIKTLIELAQCSLELGDSTSALEQSLTAVGLAREIGDRSLEAESLRQVGYSYRKMDDYQRALQYYHAAAAIAEALGDRTLEAGILNDTGVAHYYMDHFDTAFDFLERSIQRTPEGSELRWSRLGNLAAIYSALGELQRALECQHQVFQHWVTSDNPKEQARANNNLATVYNELGRNEDALAHFKQALEINRRIGDHSREAWTLNNIGWTQHNLGQLREALESYRQALALERQSENLGEEAKILTNMGRTFDDLEDQQQAMAHLERALELRRQLSDRRGEAVTLSVMAAVQCDLGNAEEALQLAERACTLYCELGDRYNELAALRVRADALRRRGDLEQSLAQIEGAISTIESMRSATADFELRASFFASKRRFYERWIDLLMELHRQRPKKGYGERALLASEQARARSLVGMLEEGEIDPGVSAPAELLQEERDLRRELYRLERRRNFLAARMGPATEDLEQVKKQLLFMAAEHQTVVSRISASSPRYHNLTSPQVPALERIQQDILDEGTILLEYALGPQRSFLWVVTATALHSFELPPQVEIESTARQAYTAVCARQERHGGKSLTEIHQHIHQADIELAETGVELSTMLLEPAAPFLGDRRLIIVPEGALAWVPFAALPVPGATDGRPLVTEHEIVVLPSISVLAVLRRQQAERPPTDKELFLLADPVFSVDDKRLAERCPGPSRRVVSTSPSTVASPDEADQLLGPSLRRLRFSGKEAEQISGLLDPTEVTLALGLQASIETVREEQLLRYRLLHFSTHGTLDSTYPQLSALELSSFDAQCRSIDGALRLHDIYRLELNADLVVLSACQTALGREIRGEGLVGLTRGFMYAGATRVLASLWKVEDEATTELMVSFYQRLLEDGERPAAALRGAQLSMLGKPGFEHPYYWAAFVLQGDWRPSG